MDETKIQEILDALIVKYQEAITNAQPSYKIGEYSVSYTEYLKSLQDQIDFFNNKITLLPSEEITLWR